MASPYKIGDEVVVRLWIRRPIQIGSAPCCRDFKLSGRIGKRWGMIRGKVRSLMTETTVNGTYHFLKVTCRIPKGHNEYRNHDYIVPASQVVPDNQITDAAFSMRVNIP